jgi:GMP synthase-like glutamine amidotransferase
MKTLRVHCFQQVDFENLGCIKTWCDDNGFDITYTRFFESGKIPSAEDYDLLIVMGGPMGVHDEEKYPWLLPEKHAIKEAIENNKIVIGICLGSQLIANVLGAKVYRNAEKEIGWFNISLTGQAQTERVFKQISDNPFKVFHWHGDTFEIPANARHLAFSEACKNQAFLYKNNVLGLQFHFEATKDSLKAMLENGKEELTNGQFIQKENEILRHNEYIISNNNRMFIILDNLINKDL